MRTRQYQCLAVLVVFSVLSFSSALTAHADHFTGDFSVPKEFPLTNILPGQHVFRIQGVPANHRTEWTVLRVIGGGPKGGFSVVRTQTDLSGESAKRPRLKSKFKDTAEHYHVKADIYGPDNQLKGSFLWFLFVGFRPSISVEPWLHADVLPFNAGETFKIRLRISNDNFSVMASAGPSADQVAEFYLNGELVDTQTYDDIPSGGYIDLYSKDLTIATPGKDYTMTGKADVTNVIDETGNEENTATKTFFVKGPDWNFIPIVIHDNVDDAVDELTTAGFTIGDLEYAYDEHQMIDDVIDQNPWGWSPPEETTVNLTVSLGDPPK